MLAARRRQRDRPPGSASIVRTFVRIPTRLAVASWIVNDDPCDGTSANALFWEFSALLTRTRVLREMQGLRAKREIDAALAEADAWFEISGAKSYEPFLHIERGGSRNSPATKPPANSSCGKRIGFH
jgi:hypothetical protein